MIVNQLNLPHFHYPVTDLNKSNGPREITDAVARPGIVTFVYSGVPYVHLLRLETYSLKLVRAKPIGLSKSPKEISELLEAQGFDRINMSTANIIKDTHPEKIASGEWRGYASFDRVPFGIFFPVKYDFSKLKTR